VKILQKVLWGYLFLTQTVCSYSVPLNASMQECHANEHCDVSKLCLELHGKLTYKLPSTATVYDYN